VTLFTQQQRFLVDHVLVLRLVDVVVFGVNDVIIAEFTAWLLFDLIDGCFRLECVPT
jgi:hypothetical protein